MGRDWEKWKHERGPNPIPSQSLPTLPNLFTISSHSSHSSRSSRCAPTPLFQLGLGMEYETAETTESGKIGKERKHDRNPNPIPSNCPTPPNSIPLFPISSHSSQYPPTLPDLPILPDLPTAPRTPFPNGFGVEYETAETTESGKSGKSGGDWERVETRPGP